MDELDRLFSVLGNGESTIHTASEVRSRIENYGPEAISALAEKIESDNDDLRILALKVVKEAALASDLDFRPLVPKLIACIDVDSTVVKAHSIAAIAALGEQAVSVTGPLIELCHGENCYLAACSINAILRIDRTQLSNIDSRIRELLNSTDSQARRVVMETIGELGPQSNCYEEQLTQMLEEDDLKVDAAIGLFKVTGNSTALVSCCKSLLKSSDSEEVELGRELKNRYLLS